MTSILPIDYDPADFDVDDFDEEFADDMLDCAWSGDDHEPCGHAGSEYCEFRCPFRNDHP